MEKIMSNHWRRKSIAILCFIQSSADSFMIKCSPITPFSFHDSFNKFEQHNEIISTRINEYHSNRRHFSLVSQIYSKNSDEMGIVAIVNETNGTLSNTKSESKDSINKENASITLQVNGNSNSSMVVDELEKMPEAPPLSLRKFLTMQEKRVVVTILFTENAGLRPFFLTVAQRIKAAHPDVFIEKRVLPRATQDTQDMNAIFEIQVDGRKINGPNKKLSNNVGTAFIPMTEIAVAISKARKRRRPATFYGLDEYDDDAKDAAVRLEMLMRTTKENAVNADYWD